MICTMPSPWRVVLRNPIVSVRVRDFTSLPTNKIACPLFMYAGGRHETPGSETKTFITASSMSSVFAFVPLVPQSLEGNAEGTQGMLCISGFVLQLRNSPKNLGRLPLFSSLFPEGDFTSFLEAACCKASHCSTTMTNGPGKE